MTIEFVGLADMFVHPDITRPDHIPVVAVNTIGVMGAGQALGYRRWDEEGFQWYRNLCQTGAFFIGEVWIGNGDQGLALFFPTMVEPGSLSDLADIKHGIDHWAHTLINNPGLSGTTWHVPKLGCGIGRLAWSDVASVLVDHLGDIEGHTFLLYGPDPQEATRTTPTRQPAPPHAVGLGQGLHLNQTDTLNSWDDWDDDPDHWPEDYNGLQISAMRYANYVKERQACSTLTR